jgi:hypothetical protein
MPRRRAFEVDAGEDRTEANASVASGHAQPSSVEVEETEIDVLRIEA